ncbi:MAG: hypothetical protein O3B44_03835 [Bacteroidetes bacterium]|nr:hypothetical protein [Bacteroidota bacterium]
MRSQEVGCRSSTGVKAYQGEVHTPRQESSTKCAAMAGRLGMLGQSTLAVQSALVLPRNLVVDLGFGLMA